MQLPARIPLRLVASRLTVAPTIPIRAIHTTLRRNAHVAPIVGTGPPPEAPLAPADNAASAPAPSGGFERVLRRRRQAEILKLVTKVRSGKDSKRTGLQSRFWKDVSVREVDGKLFNIYACK